MLYSCVIILCNKISLPKGVKILLGQPVLAWNFLGELRLISFLKNKTWNSGLWKKCRKQFYLVVEKRYRNPISRCDDLIVGVLVLEGTHTLHYDGK